MPEFKEPTTGKRFIREHNIPRYYSNIHRIRFGDNEVILTHGIEADDVSGTGLEVNELVQIVMTPRTAKIFLLTLQRVVNEFEKDIGTIPVPGNLDEIKIEKNRT